MRQKIVVLRALYLGDMLVAVPALRALRQRFLDAEITLVGLPWSRTFVERYAQYIDRLVIFPGYPGLTEVGYQWADVQAFFAQQRAYHYDLAIQMHGSGTLSNGFIHALHAVTTLGYYPPHAASTAHGLTLSAPYPQERHEIQRNLELGALLDCRTDDTRLEFPLWHEDFEEVRRLLGARPEGSLRWIGLHPGAKYPSRRWPTAYFAELAERLARQFHAGIIFTGGAHERPTVAEVTARMHTPSIDLSGQTSLGGLAALISELDLFISNDTGPAHLACAMNTPSVTLFGPADPRRWAALDQQRHPTLRVQVPCSPCAYQECPIDHRCLGWITPDRVYALAQRLLAQSTKRQVGTAVAGLPRFNPTISQKE